MERRFRNGGGAAVAAVSILQGVSDLRKKSGKLYDGHPRLYKLGRYSTQLECTPVVRLVGSNEPSALVPHVFHPSLLHFLRPPPPHHSSGS